MSQRFSRRGRSYNDVPYRVCLWICTLVSVQFRHRQSQLYSLKIDAFDEDIPLKEKEYSKNLYIKSINLLRILTLIK